MLQIHEKAANGSYHYRSHKLNTKVNPMKQAFLTAVIIFILAGPLSVFAQGYSHTETPSGMTATGTETPRMMHGKGMMHNQKQQHGKEHGGKQHGGGSHGKGRHADHEEAMQRLDMIEARLAKIEAMLEILIRR
jgi:hypothetical protein